jgi:hypothetical protein
MKRGLAPPRLLSPPPAAGVRGLHRTRFQKRPGEKVRKNLSAARLLANAAIAASLRWRGACMVREDNGQSYGLQFVAVTQHCLRERGLGVSILHTVSETRRKL